jgi:uncharacterized protein YndB with AHSA1/START domain
MSPENQSYEFKQTVQATPAQVFYAFTNATALKEWMCDVATLSPKAGGRIYLAWNSGFYAAGEFTVFDSERSLAFTWFGRNEPAPTLVEINLSTENDKTLVRLTHSGLGQGEVWANMVKEVTEGWPTSLENLASVLESGPDLRIVLRPMLGITVGDFDKTQAEHLGVPVTEGIRLDGTLETMGAYKAGLRANDVIVGIDGQPITDYASLANSLSGHRAGDKVEVIYYRGSEKISTTMELSRRPVPEIPASVPAMVEIMQKRYDQIQEQLDQLLEGVSDAEAAHKPAADEWSVNEVLTHLIHGERDGHNFITSQVGGQALWSDDYAGNLALRTNATLAALPTVVDLRLELKRLYRESVALYANIPLEFPKLRKGSWWGMAYYAAEPPYHDLGHIEQMRAAIESARK